MKKLDYDFLCQNTVFIRLSALGVYLVFGPLGLAPIQGGRLLKVFAIFRHRVTRATGVGAYLNKYGIITTL